MNLIISNQSISQHNDLYSLNDLHRASGGEKRHEPSRFIRNEQTQEIITELQKCNSPENVLKVVRGGSSDSQGTWACKELVYSYAMWISAKFHLFVIRAFDSLVTRTDSHQRAVLVTACDKLAVGNALRSDIYKMVGKQFGYDDVVSIPAPLLPEAVAYVYELLLTKKQPTPKVAPKLLKDCIHHLADYASLLKSLKHFPLLDEQIARHRHDSVAITHNELIHLV